MLGAGEVVSYLEMCRDPSLALAVLGMAVAVFGSAAPRDEESRRDRMIKDPA